MKRFPILLLIASLFLGLVACSDDEPAWVGFEKWREVNDAWMQEQINRKNPDGTPYYTKIVPNWDKQAYVLIKYLNDTKKTENNLKPIYTSTVDVKYRGELYNGYAFDSSYLRVDSIARIKLPNVIGGWIIALTNMHIGDSCEMVIPYEYAYGEGGTTGINPFSNLKFEVVLKGIPGYEIPAE